jgi:hypothetical protein
MSLTRVRATKDLSVPRYEAELNIEAAANSVRGRFATPGKHTIYDRKLQEGTRYLEAVAAGKTPSDLKKFPYMAKEVGPGKTASTPEALATLWVTMNAAWEDVSATIEEISISAKAAVKTARSRTDIDKIADDARRKLDAIGTPPPQRPSKKPTF